MHKVYHADRFKKLTVFSCRILTSWALYSHIFCLFFFLFFFPISFIAVCFKNRVFQPETHRYLDCIQTCVSVCVCACVCTYASRDAYSRAENPCSSRFLKGPISWKQLYKLRFSIVSVILINNNRTVLLNTQLNRAESLQAVEPTILVKIQAAFYHVILGRLGKSRSQSLESTGERDHCSTEKLL